MSQALKATIHALRNERDALRDEVATLRAFNLEHIEALDVATERIEDLQQAVEILGAPIIAGIVDEIDGFTAADGLNYTEKQE